MIGYITIGTRDLDKACTFYEALLAELGARQIFGNERIRFYGTGDKGAMLAVCLPYDEEHPQTAGNGNMLAIPATREQIDNLYSKALELGATGDGEPGDRIPGVFYGAYVRDPDGNKLCFYQMTM